MHIPFCFHKCHYCDFYSIVDHQDRQEAFVDRLILELEWVSQSLRGAIKTLFVGGGTPTLLETHLWERLLMAIQENLPHEPNFEFTVEANPETISEALVEVLVAGGVNRVSIGAQSFNLTHLKTLERWHDPENVGKAVNWCRAGGIRSLNLDLIFAIPGQTLEEWNEDLDRALALEPEHMSCYSLTYESNTPMTKRLGRGEFEAVEDDLEARMYELAMKRLSDSGFEQYEISAWAKPQHRCQHNLLYWTNQSWWPIGPGAAGHMHGVRWKNVPRLSTYLDSDAAPQIENIEQLDEDGRIGETLMMGLRLLDGIERSALDRLLKGGKQGESRRVAIARHMKGGLLEMRDDRLKLTDRGVLLADTVLVDLI